MLAWTIYLSFLGAGLLTLLPRDRVTAARWLALLTALAGLAAAVAGTVIAEANAAVSGTCRMRVSV